MISNSSVCCASPTPPASASNPLPLSNHTARARAIVLLLFSCSLAPLPIDDPHFQSLRSPPTLKPNNNPLGDCLQFYGQTCLCVRSLAAASSARLSHLGFVLHRSAPFQSPIVAMTHYIVGLDLTDDSSYALSWAYKNLFNDSDLVTVVTVLPGWTAEADIDPVSPSKYTPEMIQDEALATERARNIVLEMEKTHTEKHVEAYFRVIHADRDPKEALCNVAVNLKGHTLVIGHGLNKNSGFGQWVLDHSRIPVVVVRPTHLEI